MLLSIPFLISTRRPHTGGVSFYIDDQSGKLARAQGPPANEALSHKSTVYTNLITCGRDERRKAKLVSLFSFIDENVRTLIHVKP